MADTPPAAERSSFNCIYDIIVDLEFDPAKNSRNIRERGISLERFAEMDLENAVAIEDARIDTASAESDCSATSTSGSMPQSSPTGATRYV